MRSIETVAFQPKMTTSCGTLIVNPEGQILLCHVTGMPFWDIPKGAQQSGEHPFDAAKRELREETGLKFVDALYEEIGRFDYQKNRRLHLFKVRAPNSLGSLTHLKCTSYFPHRVTAKPTPEMDGYCWASRTDIRALCTLPMAQCLLSLDW